SLAGDDVAVADEERARVAGQARGLRLYGRRRDDVGLELREGKLQRGFHRRAVARHRWASFELVAAAQKRIRTIDLDESRILPTIVGPYGERPSIGGTEPSVERRRGDLGDRVGSRCLGRNREVHHDWSAGGRHERRYVLNSVVRLEGRPIPLGAPGRL